VDVVVTNTNALTGTLTGGFIYSDDDPPHVSSVFPTSGPRAGGTSITISGSGFLAGAAVELDGVAASSVTVVDSETITCDTPAGAAGVADVKVANTDGQSYTLESGFTYWPRWVATANLATSGVSMFKLDEDTGELQLARVEPVTGPTRIDAGDGYLFVTYSGGVAMYAIDPQTGDLTLSDTSGTGGTSPTAVLYDRTNGFLYVTNYGSNSIAVLEVDDAAGTLAPVPGSPFGAAGFGPVALALDDASPMLFVANQASETVAAFDVNAATGELQLASLPPQPTGGDPRALAFGSSGGADYLFCMNYGDGTVSVYDVSGGALAEVADSPADLGVASTSGCEGLLFDDSGGSARLFVVAQSPSEVLVFDVSAAGALSEVAASPFGLGGQSGQTIIKVGDAVYVALASSAAVWGADYDDADGSLAELDGSTYGVGSSSPVDIAADD
jgi:6-phosphogluconolactonase (cycloisomerase 2 family)